MRVASFDRLYRLLLPSHSIQTLIDENNYCSQLTESINNVKYESITTIHIFQFCMNNISFSITGEKICNQMQLTIPFYPDTLQLPCLKLFQSENCMYHNYSLCTSDRMPASSCLKVSGHTPMHGLQKVVAIAIDYTLLKHSISQWEFSLDMVLILQPHTQPSQPQHRRKKSVSYSFKCQHHHLLGQCPCRCMHVVLSLSYRGYTTCTLHSSVHLQCREGASSKNVPTNVMAAITKHKVYG